MEEKQIENSGGGWSFGEFIRFVLMALIIVIPIRIFVMEPFIVSGSSMVPAFTNGNYLLIDKISYKLGNPDRGDVAVFRYPNDEKKFFIKRIIGLPGETIKIEGSVVSIVNDESKDGFVLDEPYVKNTAKNNVTTELGNEEYFVMGDNRSASFDSRYWGSVNKELIAGKPILRLFPLSMLGLSPGKNTSK